MLKVNGNEQNAKQIEKLNSLLDCIGVDDALPAVVYYTYSIFVSRGIITGDIEPIQRKYVFSRVSTHEYPNVSKEMKEILNQCSVSTLKSIVLQIVNEGDKAYGRSSYGAFRSTQDISNLVYGLLKIDNDDIFVDLGSGLGTVLANVYTKSEEEGKHLRTLKGYEINPSLSLICDMVIAILSEGTLNYQTYLGDVFNSVFADSSQNEKANKGYTYPTFGVRLNNRDKIYYSDLFGAFEVNHYFNESWMFIDKLLTKLDLSNFRAVALVPASALFNMNKNPYAQTLLKNGLVEGIIELPSALMPYTGINVYLLVFSQGNKEVKSIYARDCAIGDDKKIHRFEVHLDVAEILRRYEAVDGEHCGSISCEDLSIISNWTPASMPFALNNYQNDSYTPLNQVSKVDIGCGYTSSAFETSDTPTDYRILTSGDIDENGLIKWDTLTYIKMDKTLYDKFALHKGDVIITTKSTKVKVAVVDKEPEGKLILTGGMIKVIPDSSVLNPTYLKMFLDSDEGIELLKSCASGSVMIHLSLSTFKDIKIPLIDLEKQDKKAAEYNEKLARINTYQQRIKEINDEISELINSKEAGE